MGTGIPSGRSRIARRWEMTAPLRSVLAYSILAKILSMASSGAFSFVSVATSLTIFVVCSLMSATTVAKISFSYWNISGLSSSNYTVVMSCAILETSLLSIVAAWSSSPPSATWLESHVETVCLPDCPSSTSVSSSLSCGVFSCRLSST